MQFCASARKTATLAVVDDKPHFERADVLIGIMWQIIIIIYNVR